VGVNCVSWNPGLNEKVIGRAWPRLRGHRDGALVDTQYTAGSGEARYAQELVIDRLTILDWVEDEASEQRRAA
jgi:hypothetical protein